MCLIISVPVIASSHASFYIGLTKNDHPYSSVDNNGKVDGILINFTDTICKHLNRVCKYDHSNYFQLLKFLQTKRINALIISDHIAIPEIDNLLLTPPICEISPVFIYKSISDIDLSEKKGFSGLNIGVKENSSLHLYLLNHYPESNIKKYSIMESAIFDLYFNRLDTILSDEAFYQDKVYNTPLGDVNYDSQVVATSGSEISLSYKTMSIAFSNENKETYDEIVSLILKSEEKSRNCSHLINKPLSIIY